MKRILSVGRTVRRIALGAMAALVIATASASDAASMRLQGHTLQGLPAKAARASTEPITLTFVLRHDDEAGFQRYLGDVGNPQSPNYRRYLTAAAQAERFGPSQQTYDALASWRHMLRASSAESVG